MSATVFANPITGRKLTISSSNPVALNHTTTYTFNFTVPSSTAIKSVSVDICTTASGTCTPSGGFDNSFSTLSSQPTGLGAASGWTVNTATSGSLRIVNASNSTAPSGSQTIVFGNVQNPTTANQTFYGRITTYSDASWTTVVDTGTVAASTANLIVLTGTMPESLVFCTGASITINGSGVPDCTTATSGAISFNQLFSTTSTAWATSQMAASTNASSGYVITVTGPTLTSGSNTIPAIGGSATASNIGTGQFGMNVVSDTTPAVTYFDGHNGDVFPASDNVNLMAAPSTPFATTNQYAYTAGGPTQVAASDYLSTGTGHPSDTQRYTATYIVNVAGHQAAGTYISTLTYICTPTF